MTRRAFNTVNVTGAVQACAPLQIACNSCNNFAFAVVIYNRGVLHRHRGTGASNIKAGG